VQVSPLTYIAGILAAFFAIAFGFQTVQLKFADDALALSKKDLTAANTALATAVSVAKSNTATIADLTKRLNEAVGQNERVAEAAKKATDDAVLAQQQRNTALRQLNEARKKLYATNATCAAWGSAPVCGPVSNGLRDLWDATHRADENGGSGGGKTALRGDPGGSAHGVAAPRIADARDFRQWGL